MTKMKFTKEEIIYANKIIARGRESIKKELVKSNRRIDYLEGEEFYNAIKESIQKDLK